MIVVSDSCQCSACLNKYYCADYAMIVSMQSFSKKLLEHGSKQIQVVFQVEKCSKRKVRK